MNYKEKINDYNIYELIGESADLLTEFCHGVADSCGWWSDVNTEERIERNKGELIALMHSELSEALEAIRKNKMDDHLPERKGEEVELADAVIRIFDYAGAFDLDLGSAIVEKLRYNCNRLDHKLSERALNNGKAF
jgi:NTP pyrophosphatase (non-canonical NTP hydrolase)